MSTVKISALPAVTSINANTANTVFVGVDIPTGTTGKITATVLAAGLYSNNTLVVGQNNQQLPNTVASFSLGGDSYVQTNFFNSNDGGTADHVITANSGSGGTDSTLFIDMGFANKNYQPGSEFNNIGNAIYPLDGYLYAQGNTGTSPGGNLVVGTTTSNTSLKFIVGGGSSANIVAYMTSNSLVMNTGTIITTPKGTNSNLIIDPDGVGDVVFPINTELLIQSGAAATSNTTGALQIAGGVGMSGNLYSGGVYLTGTGNGITFVDGTVQTTAAASNAYSQAAFALSNTNSTRITSAYNQANLANSIASTAVQNTAIVQLQALTLTGNLIANSTGQGIFVDTFTSNNTTTGNITVTGTANVSTLIVTGNETDNGTITSNTIVANTYVFGSATANSGVTQLTSKSTAVTSNAISGQITMNNAALAGQAYVTFTVNNSYVQHVNDVIIVNVQNSVTTPNPYIVTVGKVAVGSFNITVYNADSGGGSSHSDAIVLNYAVMRVGS